MKDRIISAIVMVIIFVPILLLGNPYYTILGSILGMMSLWELLRLRKNIPLVMQIISYVVTLFLILYNLNDGYFLGNNFYLFFIILFLVYAISVIIKGDLEKYNYKDSMWLLFISFLVGLMFNSFIKLRIIGLNEVIYCFLISTMTDTFALFGGKMFGKHKFTSISPNKTIEGSITGSIFGTIVASLFYCLVIGNMDIIIVVVLSLLLTILGQLGDLFFSSIKRSHNIKDFSQLIPGHGGILDRLDSVIFVILGFLLYILII